ncbi:DUF177 domain-containing protein [Novosphingobium sp. Chol11]|uniref:YceD family protein n=1 Tax=Novosphingobium sp. Chol11 TaxID=1385763 RepID=UPI0025DC3C23|nr:DUF177 domain-containing protein [Novosphingobium sp. Chol11]
MNAPEFSLMIDVRQILEAPVVIVPDKVARRRLAARFGLSHITAMRAEIALLRAGNVVNASGRLNADVIQPCAISGEDFPVRIDEPVTLRFVPQVTALVPDKEIEITAADCDDIEYDGTAFDLGEAVAQSLALAIDLFAEGPGAAAFRAKHGLDQAAAAGPFAALAALRKAD